MHWRRKWQPTPVFLPGESQGRGSLVGYRLWDHTELDMTEVMQQQQQQQQQRTRWSNCQHLLDYQKSKRTPEKHILLPYWSHQSLCMCRSQQTGKFLERGIPDHLISASWEICMQVNTKQLEPDMEQQTGSKLGKEYVKVIYFHPAYWHYMLSISCEMLGWMNHKLESRLSGEILTASNMQMIPDGRKWRDTKEPLDESDRGEWKSWFETQD